MCACCLLESDKEVGVRCEVLPILLLAQYCGYVATLHYLPTYIVMRGKGYNVMMIMMMTTKLAPDTGTRHYYYQIAGICFF